MVSKKKDPYYKQEAKKYERPIPSRQYIKEILNQSARPMRYGEIQQTLDLTDIRDRKALKRRLRAMERDGEIMKNRRGGYGLVSNMRLIPGTVIGHRDGFGFVTPDDKSADLFLNNGEMRALIDGDRVLVRECNVKSNGKRDALVVEIIERNSQPIVGRYRHQKGIDYVVPENKRICHDVLIPKCNVPVADGDIVKVKITEYPTRRKQAFGEITEIVGEHMAPGMEIDIAIRMYDLPYQFSSQVKKECSRLPQKVRPQDKRYREDLRELPFVTIDGEDAKDFDDAVYCEKRRGGFRLFVAIADVSYYVKPGTALDEAAYERGNSVYFPMRVLPMLPEALSNELCSLKPEVDRLAMVAEMNISHKGKITRYQFYPAIIHSHARLTYKEVGQVFETGECSPTRQPLLPHLLDLHALFKVLMSSREERGAIEFETVETIIEFSNERKIKNISPVYRNDAHRLIEECMLCANVCAAKLLEKSRLPILYRNHAPPPSDKVYDLNAFLSEMKLSFPGGRNPQPKDYSNLLKRIKSRPDYNLIQTVLLRSMSQAQYEPDNVGHFGLAYEAYAHFTSPIRRYPDLLVHRAIRHIVDEKSANKYIYAEEQMGDFGIHCSETDRRAEMATRDAVSWLKCEYMLDRVGQEFDGIITGVTGFGIFVELQSIFVEGLVHISALDNDYYHYDAVKHRLIGEVTRKTFRLGDKVRVRVARVDLDDKQIDFTMPKTHNPKKRKSKKGRKK